MKKLYVCLMIFSLPLISFGKSIDRLEYLNVTSDQRQFIKDIRLECTGRHEFHPELNIEFLVEKTTKKAELYKIAIVSTKSYSEREVIISRDGIERCRYLVKSNKSSFNGSISLKIKDKISLDGEFCEGDIGERLKFYPVKNNKLLTYQADFFKLTNKCFYQSNKAERIRNYLELPFGKAGMLPSDLQNYYLPF